VSNLLARLGPSKMGRAAVRSFLISTEKKKGLEGRDRGGGAGEKKSEVPIAQTADSASGPEEAKKVS